MFKQINILIYLRKSIKLRSMFTQKQVTFFTIEGQWKKYELCIDRRQSTIKIENNIYYDSTRNYRYQFYL